MRIKLLFKALAIILVLLLFRDVSISQNSIGTCKVLLESISKEYTGKCKDGLAHGKGIASGIDVYEGKFKKGLPHGKGNYTWKDGSYYRGNWRNGVKSGTGSFYSVDSHEITKGIWKDDAFFKEIVDPPYEVILKTGVTGVNFHEDNTKTLYQIQFFFLTLGTQSKSAAGLQIHSTSGQTEVSRDFSGMKNALFPFEGTVQFFATSKLGGTVVRYEVKFKITEANSWKIMIRY
ncbi:MAG: hypothetical protein GQ564_17585 [Bacteroidales bacterium]|nr:hypothetical protein [Bacteroidales bacterium]